MVSIKEATVKVKDKAVRQVVHEQKHKVNTMLLEQDTVSYIWNELVNNSTNIYITFSKD